MKFFLDNIFGKAYGSQFEVDKKTHQLIERVEDFSVEGKLSLLTMRSGFINCGLSGK